MSLRPRVQSHLIPSKKTFTCTHEKGVSEEEEEVGGDEVEVVVVVEEEEEKYKK